MKKRLFSIITVLALCLTLLPTAAGAVTSLSGSGTEADPYTISSTADLAFFRSQVNGGTNYKNKYFLLTADIDLSGVTDWGPIGTRENASNDNYDTANKPFQGTFNGNNHTIRNLNISSNNEFQGLFGYVLDGTVKNLHVVGTVTTGQVSTYYGGRYVGGIVGLNLGTVTNCSFTGPVKSTADSASYIGGVVGANGAYQNSGTVSNCYHFNGNVTGKFSVGGVVGANSRGTVSSSYHFGGYITGNSNVGGVAGSNSSNGSVSNCYYHSGMAATGIGSGSGSAASKTTDQFHSGEVTWLLNGSTNSGTPVWYQTIGLDTIPFLTSESSLRVYASSPCPTKFSNTSGQTENHATGSYTASGAALHEVCQNCGATGGTATLALKSGANLTYTGSAMTPCEVTCSDGWSSGTPVISYSNNTNAGMATASISLGGVNASTTFEIEKATVTVTPTSGQTKVYGTADPALTYTYSGQASGETPAFTGALSRVSGETAGTYAINIGSLVLKDNGAFKASNYKRALSSTPVDFTITKAAPALTIAADQSVVYDGAAVTAGTSGADVIYAYNGDGQVTVKWYADSNGTKGSEISAPNTVGTYWIGVSTTAGTNYSAVSEKTQKFAITQKPLTITAKPQTITYGGSIATTNDQVTATLATGDTLDSITLTPSTENVPGGTITPSAAIIKDGATDVTGCYEITYRTGTLTVKKAGQTAPTAPSAKAGATTATRIELDPITTTGIGAVQYACSTTSTAPTGEDAWLDSPVFADLVKNTPYYFFARYAGDANHDPAVSTGTRIWTLNTYTITYDLNGGSGTTPTEQTQDVGTDFTAAEQGDIARTGYTFLGWAKTANAASAAYAAGAAVSGITVDDTLYAVWKINQYTITFDTDGGSEIAPITKDYSSAVTAPAAPKKTGHTFASWEPDIPAKMPAENMTVKATWTPDVYTVTLDPNKGTIQEGNVTEYTYGVGATLPTKVTRGGYHFAGWYDNKDCKGKPVTAISTTDIGEKTFYAAWSYIAPTTYPPTVTRPGEGGSVTVSPKDPEKGDKVTITPKPEKGYEVDQVIVTDQNGKPVAVKGNGNGTFSFTQPAGKVNVKVTFKDNTPASFVDVPSGAYYETAVLWAAENGITGGTDATHFSPNAPCTRAQIVTFLWRAAGCPEPESLSSLSDVPADAYYAKAVAWALENGITTGTGNGAFSPNATCTRAQAMAFIYRSEQARGGGMQGQWMFLNPFADVNLESYYGEAVMWAVANGVTGGTTATTFSPNANCTRAQIVTFLYRNAK